jgi:formylglycine-generating enzyme
VRKTSETSRDHLAWSFAVSLSLAACGQERTTSATVGSVSAAASAPLPIGSIGPPEPAPVPRTGMAFIPGGALVAGTPPDSLPRIADEEMPGEQVILRGFYIDVFPHPNEEGAIPLTNVTQSEANGLCVEQGKRLCTELEWERACKGPGNTAYEYGDRYRPEPCGTGATPALRPSGLRVGCRSEFGARDMHGGVWEWTSSDWGRGSSRRLVTTRGGNAPAGELVGRCANAMGRPGESKAGTVGFRCCAGDKNVAEVVFDLVRGGQRLEPGTSIDKKLARRLIELFPEDARKDIGEREFHMDRRWTWRPIGNEELVVMGGCSGIAQRPACGLVVARVVLDRPKILAWASSGHWSPSLHTDVDARDLWLFGGDDLGSFRRLVGYVWGRVNVGPKERRIPKLPKSKDKKKKTVKR